jgi:hypothetical protein
MRCLSVFLLLASAAWAQDAEPPDDPARKVGRITLEKHTIFDEGEGSTFLHRAANALHIITRDHVIRRTLLFQTGDLHDPALVEETERNLRDLRFIAEAEVLSEFREDGTVDILVRTRDKFSLTVGAGGGFTGGEGKVNLSFGESNLLGLGLRVKAKYVYRKEKREGQLSFSDPRFLGSRHKLKASLALSDEGMGYGLSLFRPFFSLDTLWSWGGGVHFQDSQRGFYHEGELVNRIPTELARTDFFLERAWGDRTLKFKIGPEVYWHRPGFSAPKADDVEPGFELAVPNDRHIVGIELRPRIEWYPMYIERKELDAIDFVEDIALGISVEFGLGISYWDMEGGHGPRFPLAVGFTGAFQPAEDHLGTVTAGAVMRRGEGGLEYWEASSAFHYYYSGLRWQTLAMSVAWNAGEDRLDLPVQYTLGENSGLRGYEARFFEGDRRLRINLEDRIFTTLEVFTLRLGFVLFFDAGYAWDSEDGFHAGDLKTSAGVGIRIGSARFFQDSVLRLDLAFPFDDEGGKEISISLTSDQVFGLFRNPDNLGGN